MCPPYQEVGGVEGDPPFPLADGGDGGARGPQVLRPGLHPELAVAPVEPEDPRALFGARGLKMKQN